MKFQAWGVTDIGLKRETNQDCILVDFDIGLCLVADGMGGHTGGNIASQMSIEIFNQYVESHMYLLKSGKLSPENLVIDAYKEVSTLIYKCSTEEKLELYGMGTTLVSAFVYEDSLYIGNVGDSRAYMHKKPYLWQITEDHSLAYEEFKARNLEGINFEVQKSMITRSVITRSVGFEKNILVDLFKKEIKLGDEFLLCSDGLTGLVSDEEISKILTSTKASNVSTACVEAAKKVGGDDNISVIFMKF